ncbi:MAG: hypothetical protein HW400_959 [Candidatus Levybacteria bacterium]|nr:hypothetical protein [Candidatus Levybacteria bacterium]
MEEKVYFKASDGLKLCGILSSPRQKTQKCIILCHGIGYHKDEDENIFKNFAKRLCDLGFAVFRFDFRGHGESEGRSIDMTIAGETRDLEAAVKFLQDKGFEEFGILSQSFGGGAVSFFTSAHQEIVKALVLWNSVIDYAQWINPTLPWPIKYWGKPAFERAEKFGFTEIGSTKFKVGRKLMEEVMTLKPWKELLEILTPTLFVHGDKDNYVRVEDSIKYSHMMKNAKLEIIKGADHGFHENQKFAEQGEKATVDFLKKYL